MHRSALLRASSSTAQSATERAGNDEDWRERPVGQIGFQIPVYRFQLPGQRDGDSLGEIHHFRDMHDNDVAHCFHAWTWTEAEKDMVMIMLKRGRKGNEMHQQMAASMAITSELLWIWQCT